MIIPEDKILHLCAGYIMRDFKIPYLLSVGIAFGKEAYDYYDYGLFDPQDFGFTLFGIAIYELKRFRTRKSYQCDTRRVK